MKNRRYSDLNYHFYPFTWSVGFRSDNSTRFGFDLNSGTSEYPGCYFRINVGAYHLICELPQIIKPYKKWINYDNGGYWDEHPTSYSISLVDDCIHVYYGPQTHDSTTTKSKLFFLPWKQYRFIRESWYADDGSLMRTDYEKDRIPFKFKHDFKRKIPKSVFEIEDSDGEIIKADVYIHEREWKLGTGIFKYLFCLKKPMIKRSIEIEFEKEVGPEKGSWKGGTLGMGFDMESGENAEDAFKRFCEQDQRSKYKNYKVKFLRKLDYTKEIEVLRFENHQQPTEDKDGEKVASSS